MWSRRLGVLCTIVITAIAALAVGVGLALGQVSPNPYATTILSGSSATVEKNVVTPAIPPKVDILFLADTTGSMTGAIDNVKTNSASILDSVRGAQPDSQFGAAQYRDFDCSDPFAYQLTQAITANLTDAENGIDAWSIGNGCDTPEAQLDALFTIATDPATAFRPGSTRIVVWFGDATGHDPSAGHTIIPNPPGGDVIPALKAAGITVIAIPVNAGGDGLDNTGQATAIANATGGQVLPTTNPNDVANAILAGLQNLPVTVTPVETCDSGLTASFDAASKSGTSGGTFTFQETLTVAANAPDGGTLQCNVDFQLNGVANAAGFVQQVNIDVPLREADLSIDKSAAPALVTEGNNVTYTYTVTNLSSDADPNVVVTDALPAGLTFVSASAGCSAVGLAVTCNFGTVAAGATVSKSIVAQIPYGAPSSVTNSASVDGDRPDPDTSNNTDSATITVNQNAVNHNPVCTGLVAGPDLWPPNHKYRRVRVRGATDPDGNPLTYVVNHVTQDEPLNGAADGNTNLDAKPGRASNRVWLRAERQGTRNGRVYGIWTTVTDGLGGSCTGTAFVGVPRDRGAHHTPIDSGQLFLDF
jgi:uncharacterized repeat protein (TIGR01451 family)